MSSAKSKAPRLISWRATELFPPPEKAANAVTPVAPPYRAGVHHLPVELAPRTLGGQPPHPHIAAVGSDESEATRSRVVLPRRYDRSEGRLYRGSGSSRSHRAPGAPSGATASRPPAAQVSAPRRRRPPAEDARPVRPEMPVRPFLLRHSHPNNGDTFAVLAAPVPSRGATNPGWGQGTSSPHRGRGSRLIRHLLVTGASESPLASWPRALACARPASPACGKFWCPNLYMGGPAPQRGSTT
jgi:hypothetical protein